MVPRHARGELPVELADSLDYVDWEGRYKDLSYVSGAEPEEILLVDDQEYYIEPGQENQWVEIDCFVPPYSQEDRELEDIRARIELRIHEQARQ